MAKTLSSFSWQEIYHPAESEKSHFEDPSLLQMKLISYEGMLFPQISCNPLVSEMFPCCYICLQSRNEFLILIMLTESLT